MAKKKLTEQQEKEIKILLANNEMLNKTKEEAKLRGNSESVKLIEIAQQDTIEQIRKIDAKQAENILKTNETVEDDDFLRILENDNSSVYEKLKIEENKKNFVQSNSYDSFTDSYVQSNIYTDSIEDLGIASNDTQYDIISLPSKGQCYASKTERIAVSYLTAYDENLITSPNLYKDGLVIDFLLKHKVLDKKIKLDELCSGDVDAITLFLRATSYGPEFPVVVVDLESGEQIDSVVDLSQLKVKEFNLIGDENGHFEYTLPISKDVIKFKFLTRKDEKILKKLASFENNGVKSLAIKTDINELVDAIKSDNVLNGQQKQEYISNLNKMNEWISKLNEQSKLPFSKTITNRLELAIMAVNGNYDKKYISKYVKNMGAKDSLMLRRYMLENEPGIDFQIEVQRPMSLGGGSFKTFLEWSDSIFLNIS